MALNILDVFNGDAFSVVELTTAINLLPAAPTRISSMGLFNDQFLMGRFAVLERQDHKIQLIESAERGTRGKKQSAIKRDARALEIPHFPLDDEIEADDLIGIRAFGKDASVTEAISEVVAAKSASLRKNHDLTREYLQVGALKGVVLDGDASTTLIDMFTEFGVTQKVIDFDLSVDATDIKSKCAEVTTHVEDALGGSVHSGIHAFCGRTFWQELISHPEVKAAYDRWQDGAWLRDGSRTPFTAFGITWERYGAKVGSTDFIPVGDCRFVPTGVSDLFFNSYAPANYIEAVGTQAKQFYLKQIRKQDDTGIELLSQSNVISHCTRPAVLVRGTNT